MPTPIPTDLIHWPDEVEHNAELFDHLCELVEEIAFPVVQDALTEETAATGAEILTEETQRALEIFMKDAAILEQLDESEVIQKVRKTLSDGIIPADEEECRQHTREFSQVLVSGWLDILCAAESTAKIVILSDYLMPRTSAGESASFGEHLETDSKLPPMLMDAIGWFAVDEDSAAGVMKTLHDKLFSERRVLELPLNLIIAGGPAKVMALSRKLWDRLIELSDQYLQYEYDPIKDNAELGRPFSSPEARIAVEALSEPLTVRQYNCLNKVAISNSEEGNIEAQLRQALS